MPPLLRDFGLCFIAQFVAIDAIGIVPLFLGLTRNLDVPTKRSILARSVLVALVTALLFALLGSSIFHFVAITLSDFKIAGGLVLLLISMQDLLAGPEAQHSGSGATGVVPLAVPLITGPGLIATLMFQIPAFGYTAALLALAANFGIVWLTLSRSHIVARVIGRDGTTIVSKIVALLLAAIAVSMIRLGIQESITAFGASS